MHSENLPYITTGYPFPVTEEYLQKIQEKLPGPRTIICDPAWAGALRQYEDKYQIKIIDWNGNDPEALALHLAGSMSVILAYPQGEDLLMQSLRPILKKLNPRMKVFRFLRDIFNHVSFHLGGNFLPQENRKAFGPGNPAYFIFAIPRSGSTFFADILNKTKMLGHPREHLLFDKVPVFLTTDFTMNEWIRALVSHACTPNGYSGTKIISHLFLEIIEHYHDRQELIDDLAEFIRQYPVLYLKRRNMVRQAISLLKAQKSSVWHSKHGQLITSDRQNEILSGTPEEIEDAMIYLHDQEQKIETFFKNAGITPYVYYYEDFSDEIKRPDIFKEVMSLLKIDYLYKIPETSYAALSDDENESLVKEYYLNLEERMKNSINPEGILAHCIMSSMSAELVDLTRDFDQGGRTGKRKRKRRWKLN